MALVLTILWSKPFHLIPKTQNIIFCVKDLEVQEASSGDLVVQLYRS